ncbi:MAG: DNA-binding transcriptional repressor XynR [Phototrophicaceae bacterium]
MVKEARLIGSVQRAFDILNLFNHQTVELGITEIAKALDLHKSTASGLVYTLQANNYLEQNPDNRKYRLGLKLVERSSIVLGQLEIRQVATPFLNHLRDWSQENVNLAIRDYHEVIYIERILSNQNLSFRNEVGKRAFVHSTALGKAMIAQLPDDEALEILGSYELRALTAHTLLDIDDIMNDLALTRRRGFALDDQENELGGRCVSAPIFNHLGVAFAAISVSVPLPRIPCDRIDYFGNKAREVADDISERFGYRARLLS